MMLSGVAGRADLQAFGTISASTHLPLSQIKDDEFAASVTSTPTLGRPMQRIDRAHGHAAWLHSIIASNVRGMQV